MSVTNQPQQYQKPLTYLKDYQQGTANYLYRQNNNTQNQQSNYTVSYIKDNKTPNNIQYQKYNQQIPSQQYQKTINNYQDSKLYNKYQNQPPNSYTNSNIQSAQIEKKAYSNNITYQNPPKYQNYHSDQIVNTGNAQQIKPIEPQIKAYQQIYDIKIQDKIGTNNNYAINNAPYQNQTTKYTNSYEPSKPQYNNYNNPTYQDYKYQNKIDNQQLQTNQQHRPYSDNQQALKNETQYQQNNLYQNQQNYQQKPQQNQNSAQKNDIGQILDKYNPKQPTQRPTMPNYNNYIHNTNNNARLSLDNKTYNQNIQNNMTSPQNTNYQYNNNNQTIVQNQTKQQVPDYQKENSYHPDTFNQKNMVNNNQYISKNAYTLNNAAGNAQLNQYNQNITNNNQNNQYQQTNQYDNNKNPAIDNQNNIYNQYKKNNPPKSYAREFIEKQNQETKHIAVEQANAFIQDKQNRMQNDNTKPQNNQQLNNKTNTDTTELLNSYSKLKQYQKQVDSNKIYQNSKTEVNKDNKRSSLEKFDLLFNNSDSNKNSLNAIPKFNSKNQININPQDIKLQNQIETPKYEAKRININNYQTAQHKQKEEEKPTIQNNYFSNIKKYQENPAYPPIKEITNDKEQKPIVNYYNKPYSQQNSNHYNNYANQKYYSNQNTYTNNIIYENNKNNNINDINKNIDNKNNNNNFNGQINHVVVSKYNKVDYKSNNNSDNIKPKENQVKTRFGPVEEFGENQMEESKQQERRGNFKRDAKRKMTPGQVARKKMNQERRNTKLRQSGLLPPEQNPMEQSSPNKKNPQDNPETYTNPDPNWRPLNPAHFDYRVGDFVYNLKDKLGEGAFGRVYKAQHIDTGFVVAVKQLENSQFKSKGAREALETEIRIMKNLRSPHIVRLYNVIRNDQQTNIIMECCPDGDLKEYLDKHKGRLSEEQATDILFQILQGYKDIIQHGYLHRDIKPENLLIKGEYFKLADFGLATENQGERKNQMKEVVGSPLYMAPQLLENKPYTVKSDIWSIGLMFYEMLFGKTPWPARDIKSLKYSVKTMPLKFPIDVAIGSYTKTFIIGCLQKEEEKRFSWEELFDHPIFYHTGEVVQNIEFDEKVKSIMTAIQRDISLKTLDLKELFAKYDVQNQGKLYINEFYNLIQSLDSKITYYEVQHVFYALIKNGSSQTMQTELNFAMFKKIFDEYDFSDVNDQAGIILHEIRQIIIHNKININKLFKEYDVHGQGLLNLQQFGMLLKRIAPALREKEIKICYENFDDDGDGTVSYEEFYNHLSYAISFLQNSAYDPIKEKAAKLVKQIKENTQKRRISFLELFEQYDDDGNQTLDLIEFTQLMKQIDQNLPKREIQALFHYFDDNNDGTIQLNEFLSLLQ